MFGYITPDRLEMKGKDMDLYREYYCGVCQDLRERCGQAARMTLTYDLTFLAILLTGLYEGSVRGEKFSCGLHPGRKKLCVRNEYTAYAADMNLLLVYHNLEDDWRDEKKVRSLAASRVLRSSYLKTASDYPRQVVAIRRYLRKLHRVEEEASDSIDLAAGLTGQFMSQIFVMREDEWRQDLGGVGFYLGKFIYLMDAYEDLDRDIRSGSYNPLRKISRDPGYEEKISHILMMMASEAARCFERLPIVENVDILRNILYSGIWVRYRKLKTENDQQDQE